jgi:Domain of unknown function (DUF6265)
MKKISALALFFGLSVSLFAQIPSPKENFKKLTWIEGTWIRTNAKPGKTAYEQWNKSGEFTLRGKAFGIKGSDTTIFERTNLIIKDDAIYYVADVPENGKEVLFKLTSVTQDGFVCENPAHDFPKKISYQLTGSDLKATISGDGKSFDYLFTKVK